MFLLKLLKMPVTSKVRLLLMDHSPSKHAGSDSLLIWIWFTCDQDWLESIVQKQAWWFLHTSLYPDQIRLAKTWHSQPGPPIGPRLLLLNMFQAIYGRMQVSLKVGYWETGSRPVAFCQNQAWWLLHTGWRFRITLATDAHMHACTHPCLTGS